MLRQRAHSLRHQAERLDTVLANAYRRRASELEIEAWVAALQAGLPYDEVEPAAVTRHGSRDPQDPPNAQDIGLPSLSGPASRRPPSPEGGRLCSPSRPLPTARRGRHN